MKSFLLSYFISLRFFLLLGLLAALFVVAFFIPVLEGPLQLASVGLFGLVLVDSLVLYLPRHAVFGRRLVADRLSNGDPNPVDIFVENHYPWPIQVEVIDEIPHQFQRRDIRFPAKLPAGVNKQITYHLRPVKRGTFNFGHLRIFVRSPLGLVVRRFSFGTPRDVAVYPSYLQMRKYELLAIHNQLTDVGIKKIRRLGHNREFEQIKEYVAGDDIRTINWKATARRNQLMVNSYQDEKAQPVYAVIDKGRSMKMPFEGMTLLDYAINAALVISNIAILKSDKAGLVTFQHKDSTLVPASCHWYIFDCLVGVCKGGYFNCVTCEIDGSPILTTTASVCHCIHVVGAACAGDGLILVVPLTGCLDSTLGSCNRRTIHKSHRRNNLLVY